MPEPKRHPNQPDAQAHDDDPLVELARIVSEGSPFPAGGRSNVEPHPALRSAGIRPGSQGHSMPHQLSALEQELFSELRSTVDTERPTKRPADYPTTSSGVAAGSYDPAFDDYLFDEPTLPVQQARSQDAAAAAYPAQAQPVMSRANPQPAARSGMTLRPVVSPSGAPQATRPLAQRAAAVDPDEEVTIAVSRRAKPVPSAPPPPVPAQQQYAVDHAVTRLQDDRRDEAYADETYRAAGYNDEAEYAGLTREEIARAAREAEPLMDDDPDLAPHGMAEQRAARAAPQKSRTGMMVAAASLVLFVVAGIGFLGWRAAAGPNVAGAPPTIRAASAPLKTFPEKMAEAPSGPKLSVDKPEGDTRIVTKQEEPVDSINGKPMRVLNAGKPDATATPRTVTTMVVRPDGTVVSGSSPTTTLPIRTTPVGPASGPVTTPDSMGSYPGTTATVPSTPAPPLPAVASLGGAVPSSDPFAKVMAPARPPESQAKTALPPPATPPVLAVRSAEPPPVRLPEAPKPQDTIVSKPLVVPAPGKPVAAAPPPAAAPRTAAVPPPAPGTSQPLPLGPIPSGPRVASVDPAVPAAAPAAPRSSGSGEWVVQLSAQTSEGEARQAFQASQRKYPNLLGDKELDVQRADLPVGVRYRARAVAGSKDEAAALCTQLKQQGADCFIAKR
jgi:hypothetical protein